MAKLSPRQQDVLKQIANPALSEAMPVFPFGTIQSLMRRGLIARESAAGTTPVALDDDRLVATPAGRAVLAGGA